MNSKERSFSKIKDFACWDEVDSWLWDILHFVEEYASHGHPFEVIYGIPRGGLVPAVWLSHHLNLEFTSNPPFNKKVLFVDDVVSTGKSIERLDPNNVVSLIRNPWAPEILFAAKETDHWVQFPWENK